MVAREAHQSGVPSPSGAVDLQRGFIGLDNRLSVSVISDLLGHFNSPVEVTKLVQDRRLWSEVPKGNTAIVDLLEPLNRRLYLLDPYGNVIKNQQFERQVIKEKVAMAVVMTPALGIMSRIFLQADLEPVVDSLSAKGGGLIVVEKLPPGLKPIKELRAGLLSRISNDLIKPSFLTAYDGLCLWETRMKKPNEIWNAIQKRKRELVDRHEGVGRHKIETADGSGLNIVDVGHSTIAVSHIGEEDGVGPEIGFKSNVVVSPLGSRAEQNLNFALANKARREVIDNAKTFITDEMLNSHGFPIEATCPTRAHGNEPPHLTRTLRKLRTLKTGRIKVSQDTACGQCDYRPARRTVTITLKPYTKVIDGKTVKGWVSLY